MAFRRGSGGLSVSPPSARSQRISGKLRTERCRHLPESQGSSRPHLPSRVPPRRLLPTHPFSSDPSPRVLRDTDGAADRPGLWGVLAGGGGTPKGELILIRGQAGAAGRARGHPGVPGGPEVEGLIQAPRGRGPAPPSVLGEEVRSAGPPALMRGRLMPLSSHWLVWFHVTAESQQG